MKAIYELNLDKKEHPKYVLRSADLFELMANELREEANGGDVVSSTGHKVVLGTEYLELKEIQSF